MNPAGRQSATSGFTSGFEEDDGLRSAFIRQLTLLQIAGDHTPVPIKSTGHTAQIPRILVRYWHDPHEVPADVRECLDSWWGLLEDGFSIRMFDDVSARTYIAEQFGRREVTAFDRCRHPAMRSDYFRMCFVLAEGGLYVDADDVLLGDGWRSIFEDGALKLQPLCYDLETCTMVSAADLRRTDLPTKGRIFYVNNNPIAAPPGHPVLRRALARATDALFGENPEPEIQSTTGPGNLTASLAAHANELQERGAPTDFALLLDWDSTAEPRWDLAYRGDARNWRNMEI